MSLIVILFCSLLLVFSGVEGEIGYIEVKENNSVPIQCKAGYPVTTVFWFRLKEKHQGFEYVAMYSKSKNSGKEVDPERFKVTEKYLEVKQFDRLKDSGTYSCVSINNNVLKFTGTTELHGEPVPTTIKTTVETIPIRTVASVTTAVTECTQKTKASANLDVILGCEQEILIPLVASCGFLLLLLIITIFYCNRIRTRRCPHHYKRQPRTRPRTGHKALPKPLRY